MKKTYLLSLILLYLFNRAQVAPVCFNSLIAGNSATVGGNPREACVADVNGDGRPDIVTVNSGSNNISVLLSSGQGSFATPVNYSNGVTPWSVCLADFNSDGSPDVATCGPGSAEFYISLNSGSGTFSSVTTYTSLTGPYSIRSADFNHDGNPDLAVTYSLGVCIYMGSSTGTFATSGSSYTTGTNARFICINDFNSDGEMDLAVANQSSSNVSLLLGSSSGTFAAAVSYTTGNAPLSITSADFNGDGHPDLAICNPGSDVSLLMGSVSGTFASATSLTVGSAPYSISSADFNADGKVDLAVSNFSAHTISLLSGNGSGGFSAPFPYQVSDYPSFNLAADFNSDGTPDIASLSYPTNKVAILLNNGNGNFAAAIGLPTATTPVSVASADFNGDGKMDIVTPNYSSGNVSVLLATSGNMFYPPVNYSVGPNPTALTAADFNNDGKPDIVVNNYFGSSFSLLLGSATGTFSAATFFSTHSNPYGLVSADFNMDGNNDIAVSNTGTSAAVAIYMGTGTGSFAASVTYTNPPAGGSLAASDFNGDGYADIAVLATSFSQVSILFGSSSGTFAVGSSFNVSSLPTALSVADFNADGKNDLVVTNYYSNTASVLIGTGTGSFATAVSYNVGTVPCGVCTGDFNMDGFFDFASSNIGTSDVSVLLGDGTGLFGTPFVFSAGATPRTIISGDFNADGKPDLAVACASDDNVNVLLNGSPTLSLSITSTVCLGNSIIITAYGANSYTWSNNAIGNSAVFTPVANTTYSVVAKSFGGCATTAAKSITVNALPLPTVTANSGSICSGNSFSLNPSGANIYTISGGQSVVTPLTNGSYTIIGTNTTTGCYSSVIAGVSVAVTPTLSVTSGTLCEGKSFTIVPAGAPNYTIQGGSYIVSPTISTTYSVVGSSSLGCLSNVAIANISVFPAPVISVNSGSICIGNSFTINSSGASNYFYASGSQVVAPQTTTNYVVFGISNVGCMSNAGVISHVTVMPLPTLSVSGNGFVCQGSVLSLLASGTANTYSWSNGVTGNLVTLSPTVSTTYTITGTDNNNCSSTITKFITVNPLPLISVNSGSVCDYMTFTFTPSGAISYTFPGGSAVYSPLGNTLVTIYGSDNNGCVGAATSSITTVGHPALGVTNYSPIFCAGETTTLVADGASTYTWNGAQTGNPLVVVPLQTQTMVITGANAFGCTSSMVFQVDVQPCVSVVESSEDRLGLSVHPNPGAGIFIITSESLISVRICNAIGQMIGDEKMFQGKMEIDLLNYSDGVYFIHCKWDNSLKTFKLIKQN